jgi:uncharacterized protein YjbI with pentapeptide repeats
MKQKKYFLAVIFSFLFSVLFLSVELYAYKESDLKKLKDTKKCLECDLSKANLKEANLNNIQLNGANLRKANLTNVRLRMANLYVTDLSGANLSNADLSGANLRGANLTGANLSWANLTGARLNDANLTGANLKDANLKNAKLSGIQIDKKALSTLSNNKNLLAKFKEEARKTKAKQEEERKKLLAKKAKQEEKRKKQEAKAKRLAQESNIKKLKSGQHDSCPDCDLSMADLSGLHLSEGANLDNANLSDANLTGVSLSGVSLSGAKLRGANLSGADLTDANLSGTNLSKANLSKANLSDADLSGADLSGADLSGANLSVANLTYANLTGARLNDANLTGANLKNTNLTGANLKGIQIDKKALSTNKILLAKFEEEERKKRLAEEAKKEEERKKRLAEEAKKEEEAKRLAKESNIKQLKSTKSCPKCDLSGADLSGAYIPGANLSGANLSGAYIPDANLTGANLSGANLSNANLTGANLSDADLTGTNLSGIQIDKKALSTNKILLAKFEEEERKKRLAEEAKKEEEAKQEEERKKLLAELELKKNTIKTCYDNIVSDEGYNYWVFPEDGGRPYGASVELLLFFTNRLNLKLEVEKDSFPNCINKLRNGEIDIMPNSYFQGGNIQEINIDDDRKVWFEYLRIWTIDADIVFSKKSKFARKMSSFDEHFMNDKTGHLDKVYKRKYLNSFDHSWYGYEKDEIEISYNCKKEAEEKKDDDSLDLTELADDSSDKETCEKRKLSEVTAYIDKEFIFSLYMNQMSEIVNLKKGLYIGADDRSHESKFYHVFGPVFFNINSPSDSILFPKEWRDYTRFSKKLDNNINYCLNNPSACVYFDEAVVTHLVMKNSYNIDFSKSDSICNQGIKPIVVYSKDTSVSSTLYVESITLQRISFQGSCFERNPPHYFFGRQDSGFKSAPFKGLYGSLIGSLASYHLANTWNNKSSAKTHLKRVKNLIKETKKIFPNQDEWKGVTKFLTGYGKLMQNTIKTRKQVIEAAETEEKRQDEQKISDLKNKVRTPVNLEEALVYFNVKYGGVPVFSTPYKPDGNVYGVHGTIKGMIGKYYRIKMENIVVGKRDFLLNTSETLSEGQHVQIVGTFNEVEMLSTLFSDIEKPYAVFSDIKYLNGRLK